MRALHVKRFPIFTFTFFFSPDPNVKWLKDENPVVLSPNCRSTCRDGLVTLDLAQLKPDDSGVYKLICRNASGEISCSCRLMVYEIVKEGLVAPLFTMPIKGKSLRFVKSTVRTYCVFNHVESL